MFTKLKGSLAAGRKGSGSASDIDPEGADGWPPKETQNEKPSGMFAKLKLVKNGSETGSAEGVGSIVDLNSMSSSAEQEYKESNGTTGGGMSEKSRRGKQTEGMFSKLKGKKASSNASAGDEGMEDEGMFSKLKDKKASSNPGAGDEGMEDEGMFSKPKGEKASSNASAGDEGIEDEGPAAKRKNKRDGSVDVDAAIHEEKKQIEQHEHPQCLHDAKPQDIELEEVDDRGFGRDAFSIDIEVNKFDQLLMDGQAIAAVRSTWAALCRAAGSREAAGETMYNAVFEGAPALQSLFKTPRGVQAARFAHAISGFVQALDTPEALKVLAEMLSFEHMNLDVTAPRVALFRDLILDVFVVELDDDFSESARAAWTALLNYIGGAMIFVRTHYADRLRIISMSWREANKGDLEGGVNIVNATGEQASEISDGEHDEHAKKKAKGNEHQVNVPTNFQDMFTFNLLMLGFDATNAWMREILDCFGAIVVNMANTIRLQEECEVLALRISRVTKGDVDMSEFKACMLATLRSLLPKLWEPSFEVAWSWLWENVERILVQLLGRPAHWQRALIKMLSRIDENRRVELRAAIYSRFFCVAPAGQDFFKQSNTRLNFISSRIFEMTVEMFKNPVGMVDEISGLGLRHVGYAIPTDLIAPFVTAYIETVATASSDETALEAFRWSLGLISKILVRTINEGSTVVMKAINLNSTAMLQKAVSVAPRNARANSVLLIQVGKQKISPLMWAIDSGSLEAATAMIKDLLTIRADRENYYYGMEDLFGRHPDFIQRLSEGAQSLLPTLFEGLSWRQRQTRYGVRRVNYYVKYLLVNHDGGVSQALKWLAKSNDPKIIAHPIIAFVSDTFWRGVVSGQFSLSKIWFVFSLLVFLVSQAILPKRSMDKTMSENLEGSENLRITIFICRCLTYVFSLGRLFSQHARKCWKALVGDDCSVVGILPVPNYLLKDNFQLLGFCLLLFLAGMACFEPMFHCRNAPDAPTELCPEATPDTVFRYSVFSALAMFCLWLLVIDLSVFSTKLSAFVLVVGHVGAEVGRFMVALMFLLLTFASAISVLKSRHEEFQSVFSSVLALSSVTLGVYEKDYREFDENEQILMWAVFIFVMASAILLLNLLIAQLNCSYEYVYADMVGFARMNRAKLIVDSLAVTSEIRWSRFVKGLCLDQPIEFDEGDVGPPGGIQILEGAGANPVLVDQILRFGGSTSGELPWPEDPKASGEEASDRFEHIETIIEQAVARTKAASRSTSPGSSRLGGSKDE